MYTQSDSSAESCFYTSSSSSSTSSDDEFNAKTVRVENFLDVIKSYSDEQFRAHFRLKRSVSQGIIDKYNDYVRQNRVNGGRVEIGPTSEIYITLWFLANTETYRQVSDRFNVTKSSVFRIIRRVVDWLVIESANYIKWPTASEMQTNQIKFAMRKNFPRVVGAIDGSHIRINAPKTNKDAYYNRKKYYSILIQCVVDADKKFIDVHCGEPGSMHDSRLLQKSYLYAKLKDDPSTIIEGGVLLGDSAYQNSSYLVTPYKDFGNLSAKQKKFNYLHSATRVVVENAFGLLKGRFRRLYFFESPCLGFVTNCVLATCVLHNICVAENDMEEWPETENDPGEGNDEHASTNQLNSLTREEIFNFMDNQHLL